MSGNAFDRVNVLRAARDAAGALLLGLDFDGTLAPIVPRPDDAALPEATRDSLAALARRPDTRVAFISGRSLADLRGRVGLELVYYAGNHGLEIEGPAVHQVHEEAAAARDTLALLARELEQTLPALPGVIVEDKGLTLSVHYRMVHDEAGAELVRERTRECAARHTGIHLTEGKKVVEIRPAVDWHKGRALRFLRETIEARYGRAPVIFIGDDRTDEDAFRELGETDCAIVVGDPPPAESVARVSLRSTDDVAAFLRRLV